MKLRLGVKSGGGEQLPTAFPVEVAPVVIFPLVDPGELPPETAATNCWISALARLLLNFRSSDVFLFLSTSLLGRR